MSKFDFLGNERLAKQLDFIVTCDEMKHIIRRTVLMDASRRENDAEHSWHLAMCAMIFEEYAPEKPDMHRVLRLVTVHDLVEIYAGDTFAYDKAGNKTKREREVAAAEKLFGSLPEEQGKMFRELWDEYEAVETPESRYALAMDRIQPLLHNFMTEGFTWKEGAVHASWVLERIDCVKQAVPEVYDAITKIIEKSVENGILME